MGLIAAIGRFVTQGDPPQKADVICVPGCPFGEPMTLAIELWKKGTAPLLLPSGNRWMLERADGPTTEWQRMAGAALAAGVPAHAILREDRATHTLDNARLSRRVLEEAGVPVQTLLVCCRDFHARRCRRAYERCFPQARVVVCTVPAGELSVDDWFRSGAGWLLVVRELMKSTGLFFWLIGRLPPGWRRGAHSTGEQSPREQSPKR